MKLSVDLLNIKIHIVVNLILYKYYNKEWKLPHIKTKEQYTNKETTIH